MNTGISMTGAGHWPQTKVFVWLACAGLAGLADVMFWGQPVGCSAAVFAGAVIAAHLGRVPGVWKFGLGRVMAVLAVVSVLALVEEPSPLALLVVFAGLGTLVLVARREVALADRVSAWMLNWVTLLATIPVRIFLDNVIVARWLRRHPQAAGRIERAAVFIAWWVLPVLAGMVFIGLFALANPIIEKWLREGFDQLWRLFDWLAILNFARVVLWIVVAVGAYGLLRYRRIKVRRRESGAVRVPPVVAQAAWLQTLTGPGMIIRCLAVFNAVFAVQSGLDMVYLFGGAKLPAGMTYAHYAHRGAYPLVFTALLAGLFVVAAFKSGGAAQRSAWSRRFVYVWIGQNVFLLISTIWRLWLYVDAYSLTRLRVAAMIWIALVGLGFLWIVGRIAGGRSNAWLWRMNAVTLLGVLYVCAFVNFDGLIADFNVRHCREVTGEGVAMDIGYLRELGPEALPALGWLRERDEGQRGAIDAARAALTGELKEEMRDWRGWTYRRWRVAPAEARVEVARN